MPFINSVSTFETLTHEMKVFQLYKIVYLENQESLMVVLEFYTL